MEGNCVRLRIFGTFHRIMKLFLRRVIHLVDVVELVGPEAVVVVDDDVVGSSKIENIVKIV